jgi:hypothetical protein
VPKPWERQPKESESAYADFRQFLDLGAARTITEAYRHKSGKKQASQAAGEYKRTASRWQWIERARAWDNHIQRVRDQQAARAAAANERSKLKALDEGLQMGWALLERAKLMLQFPLSRVEKEEPAKNKDGSLIRDSDGNVVYQKVTFIPLRWSARDIPATAAVAFALMNEVHRTRTKDPAKLTQMEKDAIAAILADAAHG